MILYRFALSRFSKDLSGEGARRFGGRWNSKGHAVVYTSITISLSLLELLIHSAGYEEMLQNQLLSIELPTNNLVEITLNQLKAGWQNDEDYLRYIGDEFITSQSALLMKVPSVIVPEEYNILINPKHKDFNKLSIKSLWAFNFDVRLFKK